MEDAKKRALEKFATVKELCDKHGDKINRKHVYGGALIEHFDVVCQALAEQPAQQEPVEVDQATMELAESVGLIGPASRTHELHCAIQRFHDLICVNATIKAAKMAADAICESTFPQAQRTWVGLTEEEITDIWAEASPYYHEDDFARAIEAKLKEKNGIKGNT